MKPAKWMLSAMMAAAVAGTPATLLAQSTTAPAEPAIPSTQSSNPLNSSADLTQSIRTAPDPSTAVAAYAKAQAAAPNDGAAEEAYLRRMVDFGLPEMADAQALDLIKRDPANGLAWGVAAYVSAKQGQMDAAMSEIVSASRRTPDDPFIQRTAGQMLAWYDAQADKSGIPEVTRQGLETVRKGLSEKPAFAEAYRRAQEFYQAEAAGAATTQPREATVGTPAPATGQYATEPSAEATPGYVATSGYAPEAPLGYTYNTYNYYPSYPSYPSYPAYTDPFPYGYSYADTWWRPSIWWGSSFVIVDRQGHSFRDHDRFFSDRDRGFHGRPGDNDFDHHRPHNGQGFTNSDSNRLPRVTAPMTAGARFAPSVGPQIPMKPRNPPGPQLQPVPRNVAPRNPAPIVNRAADRSPAPQPVRINPAPTVQSAPAPARSSAPTPRQSAPAARDSGPSSGPRSVAPSAPSRGGGTDRPTGSGGRGGR